MEHHFHLRLRWRWRFLQDQETGLTHYAAPVQRMHASLRLPGGAHAGDLLPQVTRRAPQVLRMTWRERVKGGRRGRGACMGGVGERRRSRNNFKRRHATSLALRDVSYPCEVCLFASIAVQDTKIFHLVHHIILKGDIQT